MCSSDINAHVQAGDMGHSHLSTNKLKSKAGGFCIQDFSIECKTKIILYLTCTEKTRGRNYMMKRSVLLHQNISGGLQTSDLV